MSKRSSSSCPGVNRRFDPVHGYSQAPPLARPLTLIGSHSLHQTHNLTLESYSFDDLLQMFGLTYRMTVDDLKTAKRRVLMVHPDKSGLPSDYFLFYKRAFEHIVQYYNNQSRQNQVVNEHTPIEYVPLPEQMDDSGETHKIRTTVEKMSSKQFNSRFNDLFEQNMHEKPDETRNEWFRNEQSDSVFTHTGTVNAGNLGSTFESIKAKQREAGLVRYTGIRELSSFSGGLGANYYDTAGPSFPSGSGISSIENNDNSGVAEEVYVSSDPFSKLRFEDLRKVHKDQTVFAVSESDYNNVRTYNNVEQYSRERNSPATLTPMEKAEAQRILDRREDAARERAARQQHYAELKSQEYAAKNRTVMGAFLHLENGRR